MLWFGSTSLHASLHCMLCSTSKHCMLCIASTSLHALLQHHCMLRAAGHASTSLHALLWFNITACLISLTGLLHHYHTRLSLHQISQDKSLSNTRQKPFNIKQISQDKSLSNKFHRHTLSHLSLFPLVCMRQAGKPSTLCLLPRHSQPYLLALATLNPSSLATLNPSC